jgi:endonuclease-3
VARSSGASRQPLSQRKPKVAAGKGAGAPIPRAPVKSAKANGRGAAAAKTPAPVAKRGRCPAPDPQVVFDRLLAIYPDAHCELDFTSPFQLLVATILSAQCTDRRVNMVTPVLFAKYPTPEALAAAKPEELEEIIKSTGFFRAKTKSLLGMANAVVERHGGEIPRDMDALVQLPGVGRKTANVLLGNAWDINEGVVVDTHVARLSDRLALSRETDPVKIEQDLMKKFRREQWTMLSHLLIWHGRRVCEAKKPRCEMCVLNDICPSAFIAGARGGRK